MVHNAVSKIAYQMVGGSRTFYQLRKEERVRRRALAAELHEAGATIASAEAAEKTRMDGFLYVIAHPRLQGVKVGRAFDPESRLRGYQTGCPERAYYLAHVSPYFEDCVSHEKVVHEALNCVRLQGEWFDAPLSIASHIIDRQSPFRSIQ